MSHMDRAPARRPAGDRRTAVVCAVVTVLAGLAACGLPDEGRSQVVEDASVPYGLLAPSEPDPEPPEQVSTVPRDAPVVFWLRRDERLVPAAAAISCREAPARAVSDLLDTLTDSPSSAERESGLASAIPPAVSLTLVQVRDGVAEIELDPLAIGDAERLPLAVGQVVLSVTSAPGVDAVSLVTSGQPVDVPLPGGALVSGTATADDYADLVPLRLRSRLSASGDIGCSGPE